MYCMTIKKNTRLKKLKNKENFIDETIRANSTYSLTLRAMLGSRAHYRCNHCPPPYPVSNLHHPAAILLRPNIMHPPNVSVSFPQAYSLLLSKRSSPS